MRNINIPCKSNFRNVLKNFEIFMTDILHIGEALLKVDPLQPAQVVGLIHCGVLYTGTYQQSL